MARDPEFTEKVSRLADLFAETSTTRVVEILRIFWQGGAGEHYSDAPWDQSYPALIAQGVANIQARFERKDWFTDIPRSTEVSDDVVKLRLWDGDQAISDKFHLPNSGEGTRLVIRQYFPDVNLLNEIFWGYLKAPKESEGIFFQIDASTGLRSPNLMVPRRAIYSGCQAIFAGIKDPQGNYYFDTQEKINLGDCPYNLHIGGSVGKSNPATGQPYDFCPRARPSDCSDRIQTPPPLPYLAFDVAIESNIIGSFRKTWVATTKGNDAVLRQPLTVAYGRRWIKDLKLLAYAPESGSSNPEAGFLRTLWAICEGTIGGLEAAPSNLNDPDNGGPAPPNPGTSTAWSGLVINSQWVQVMHCHFGGSWGAPRQSATDFSANVLNYSSTSVIRANYGRIDTRGFTPDQIQAQAYGYWKKDVRVYTAPATYTRKWTDNRLWCFLDMYLRRRYGYGVDVDRLFDINELVDVAAYCDELVSSVAESGAAVNVRRTHFNAQIDESKSGEFLRAICGPGYFSIPYHMDGKLHITKLETLVPASVPTFSDEGTSRNIINADNRSTLKYSEESQSKIPNEIKLTFDDENYQNMERPLQINDYDAQLRAGRAAGDNTFRPVTKEFSCLGMTNVSMAARYARRLLDLGEFEEGGTKNNFKIKFSAWSPSADAADLHPYSIIRVLSSTINRFTEPTGEPYEYFRVLKLHRRKNLLLDIEAILYPQGYVSSYLNWKPAPVASNPGGSRSAPPLAIELQNVSTQAGIVRFTADLTPESLEERERARARARERL